MQIIANRYVLIGEPRYGGMSVLHKALDTTENGKNVAVKIYSAKPIDDEILHESFKRERMALRELKHNNIVSIYDEGFIQGDNSYFIVLEWLEQSYSNYVAENKRTDWATFYRDIGRPILDAIAFAHNRSYAHRDIKTSNIMLSDVGLPKIIEFGTSKLKRYITYGRTLREFSSEPFAPPEPDDGSYSYSRDTYGYCVAALHSIFGGQLVTRTDVLHALAEATLTPAIRDIFSRALTEDPDDRYANADALMADFEAAERHRLSVGPRRPDCYIQLTARANSVLCEYFGVTSHEAVEQMLSEDLNTVCGVRPFKPSTARAQEELTPQYQLFGAEFSYHVKVDGTARDRLIILNVRANSPFQLEKLREGSFPSPVRFRTGIPLVQSAATRVLEDFDAEVQLYFRELEESEKQEGAIRLFDIWKRMLEVKYEYEIQQQDSIRYRGFDVDGSRLCVRCESLLKVEHQGQQRALRLHDGSFLTGEITGVDFGNNEMVFATENAQPDRNKIPHEGYIVLDINSNKISIDRQRNALEAVRTGSEDSIRSDLGDLIAHPEHIDIVREGDTVVLFQDLDSDKQVAVRKVRELKDFLLIDGPPGTGKTTLIAEIVLQELARHRAARILLTSQTNVALDNAVERIEKVSAEARVELSITRLGRFDDDRISAEVRKYLIPSRMDVWKQEALRRSDQFLEKWGKIRGVDPKKVATGMLLEQLIQLKHNLGKIDGEEHALKEVVNRGPLDRGAEIGRRENIATNLDVPDIVEKAREDLARVRDEQIAIRRQIEGVRADLSEMGEFEADLANVDEVTLRDFLVLYQVDDANVDELRKMLKLSAEWRLRFGVGTDFQTALMSSSNLVAGTCIAIGGTQDVTYDLCILDEASKATATEAMVPLSRARRWIMLGDLQQLPPFQDEALRNDKLLERFELQREDLKITLFSHLLNHAPAQARVRLSSQRRMVRQIGELISVCFYNGTLETKTDYDDLALHEDLGRPVTWLSTSKLPRHYEDLTDASIRNIAECEQVLRQLKKLSAFADTKDRSYSVCVLTPYSGQIAELQHRIVPELARWTRLNIEIRTVDSYQGREADIARVSLVRSNETNTLGFMKEHERLNVALSRARLARIIVGDRNYLYNAKDPNPFREVLGYIERNPADCRFVEARQ